MGAVTLPRGAYFDLSSQGRGAFRLGAGGRGLDPPQIRGYVLMAVEAGYRAVNESSVTGSVLLKDGDFIDCGGTTMQFVLKETNN